MKKKRAREPRLDYAQPRPKRVEKLAYLPPEQAALAEARAAELGLSFSGYLNRLVRADLDSCK